MPPNSLASASLETHFEPYRLRIPGRRDIIETPYGPKRRLYADTTASGQPDAVIEDLIMRIKLDYANTHSDSNHMGGMTTQRYHLAGHIIKEHVNAGDNDILITAGSGMSEVVNKLVRMMGLAVPERFRDHIRVEEQDRPVVFITHVEHHSNILPWQESIADVITVPPDEDGLPDPEALAELCARYKGRPLIGSFSAASNVTGIRTPYQAMAKVMHAHGGKCIVDFAASAPYDPIDMHPPEVGAHLDAVLFSPHKFQGGPESPGILVAHRSLIQGEVPDRKGGGTVHAVDGWGGRWYVEDLEAREDGGTPPIIGRMRAAMAIRLKELMGMDEIKQREHELVNRLMSRLAEMPNVHVFEPHLTDRLGIVSLYMDEVPHGLLTRVLNDRFGIQVRNGCSCAGPYGHYLLDIERDESARIIKQIVDLHDETNKPGWVRISLHPTMMNAEVDEIVSALEEIGGNIDEWRRDYTHVIGSTDFIYTGTNPNPRQTVEQDFDVS